MALSSFIESVKVAIQNDTFVKLSLGNYKGAEAHLKNIYAKLVLIKKEVKLSFTYRYNTQDIIKNMPIPEGLGLIESQLTKHFFCVATLFTTKENVIVQLHPKNKWIIRTEQATTSKPINLTHDRTKARKIDNNSKKYLHELRLTDREGNVFKNAQDKWKQINHYIDLLSSELEKLSTKDTLKVVDMGAGKGYLTFALHDYLSNELQLNAHTTGVEYRQDLVTLCNQIIDNTGFENFTFQQGTIASYQPEGNIDVLIALHACDTATDDAIYKGIEHQAKLIVVAPCCHKQVRQQLEKEKAKNELDFIVKYGIFLERQAEMLTDSIRALILEYFGYQTKVMQFVSDSHTPKNIMIVGVKKTISTKKQAIIKDKLLSLKKYFGIQEQHLERISGIL